jgi:hypothetical protein
MVRPRPEFYRRALMQFGNRPRPIAQQNIQLFLVEAVADHRTQIACGQIWRVYRLHRIGMKRAGDPRRPG